MTINNLYALGNALSKVAKEKYDKKIIRFSDIKNLKIYDPFGELIFSRATNTPQRVKIAIIAWFLTRTTPISENLIKNIINNLYFYKIQEFEDLDDIYEDCDYCNGDGVYDCEDCAGTGELDCEYCDGNGVNDCDDCKGNGEIDCDRCDGEGVDPISDDDDEVDCYDCDGKGEVDCKDCDGKGEVACRYCDRGKNDCTYCQQGTVDCDYCYGSGEIDTGEKKYRIRTFFIVTYGNVFKDYNRNVGIDKNEFDNMEIDHLFTFDSYYYDDDIPYEERQVEHEVDDDFVLVIQEGKLMDDGMYPNFF